MTWFTLFMGFTVLIRTRFPSNRTCIIILFFVFEPRICHIVRAVRDFLVHILPKAPNLDQMSPIPYLFDFWRAPRKAPPGAAILGKSNMAATCDRIQSLLKTKRAIIMSNTTFSGFSGSGNPILILFRRFEVKVTPQGHPKCHFCVKPLISGA